MRLLVLGGTGFLGRHVVEAALAAGHDVTLLNRGRTNPELFPEVEKLVGDRDGDLAPLRGRRWDAAIDVPARIPRQVQSTTNALEGIEHYTFVSSISAYRDFSRTGIDESAPVLEYEPTMGDDDMETYGARKAECERIVAAAFPAGALIVRPGLIVGPHDPTDRFTYWPARVDRGGEILAPGPPGRIVQFIDARDLAPWIVRMVEERRTGAFNVDGIGTTEAATRLGEAGYAVWHGNYYALEVMNRLGLEDEGAVRAGIVHYNTAEEVDGLLAAIAAL